MMITFPNDIGKRKRLQTPESFRHPAKMHIGMLLWCIGKYTQPGDVILDPMAGSGSTLLATRYSRNVVTVELEPKFVEIQRGNWSKIQELGAQPGHTLGSALILQGDARNLQGLLADNVIMSPLYEATFNEKQHTLSGIAKRDASMRTEVGGYSGGVDTVISSPPYEGSLQGDVSDKISAGFKSPSAIKMLEGLPKGYSKEVENIGNLRKESYLQAMLTVYQQCYNVLKADGLMILVTKDFIRKKQRVLLSMDTLQLCELAGFNLFEWHQRKLTQQSFWRTLYHQKHPEVEMIETEDILVFKKDKGWGIFDKIISSPPFKEQMQDVKWMQENQPRKHRGTHNPQEQDECNIGNLSYGEAS